MTSPQDRDALLMRDGYTIGIVGLSVMNGMHFSPWFDPLYFLMRPFAPGFFIASPLLLFYFTSLFITTVSFILSGIIPALFERFTGRATSDTTSLRLWLAIAFLMSLPTLFYSPSAAQLPPQ